MKFHLVCAASALAAFGMVSAVSVGLTQAPSAVEKSSPQLLPFTLFIYETPEQFALRKDTTPAGQAYWASFAAYGQALTQAGVIRGGAPLAELSSARVVRSRGGTPDVTDRPAFTPPENMHLGGYFQIEAASAEEAYAWAAKAPCATTGFVEVRPGIVLPKP